MESIRSEILQSREFGLVRINESEIWVVNVMISDSKIADKRGKIWGKKSRVRVHDGILKIFFLCVIIRIQTVVWTRSSSAAYMT